MNSHKSNGGFSLVEIMVAMVGISLVVLLLTSILITSVRSAAAGQNRDYMLMGARAKMNELTADFRAELTGRDQFPAPNGRIFQREWGTASATPPFTVTVRVWDDNDEVMIRGIIQHECVVNVPAPGNSPGRPQIRFADRPTAEDVAPTVDRIGMQVPTEPTTRLFTVIPTTNANSIGRLRIAGASGAGHFSIVNDNEIHITPQGNGDTRWVEIYFAHCSTRTENGQEVPIPTSTSGRLTRVNMTFTNPPPNNGNGENGGTTYNVTFNYNNGSGTCSPNPMSGTANTVITLPQDNCLTPPTGFQFDGWNTQANGSGTNFSAGASYTITGNTTLYAIWKPIPCQLTGTITAEQVFSMYNNTTRDFNVVHGIATSDNSPITWTVSTNPASDKFSFNGTVLRVQSGVSSANYFVKLEATACNNTRDGTVKVNVSPPTTCEISGSITPTSFDILATQATLSWRGQLGGVDGSSISWTGANITGVNRGNLQVNSQGQLHFSSLPHPIIGTHGIRITATANCGTNPSITRDVIIRVTNSNPVSCGDKTIPLFAEWLASGSNPVQYYPGDYVVWNNGIYRNIQSVSNSHTPTNGLQWLRVGSCNDVIVFCQGLIIPRWSASMTVFERHSLIIHGDEIFVARNRMTQTQHDQRNPRQWGMGQVAHDWRLLGNCANPAANVLPFRPNTAYGLGDVAVHNNAVWITTLHFNGGNNFNQAHFTKLFDLP